MLVVVVGDVGYHPVEWGRDGRGIKLWPLGPLLNLNTTQRVCVCARACVLTRGHVCSDELLLVI